MIKSKDISVRVSMFFMKLIGIWTVDDPKDKIWRQIALAYTASCMIHAIIVQTRGLYFSFGKLSDFLYTLGTSMTVAMVLCKMLVLFVHKKEFFWLLEYMDQHYWHSNYSSHEKSMLMKCNKGCALFIVSFVIFMQFAVVCFAMQAYVANRGKNDSDRIFPFALWTDIDWLVETPYYEVISFAQILSLYHVGFAYYCCDNFLCLMSLHIGTQFRILQNRLRNLCDVNILETLDPTSDKVFLYYSEQCHESLKSCVRDHQALINFCHKLENVFREMALWQVLSLSALMCLQGLQLIQSNALLVRRLIFISYFMASMTQLYMFTYSCDHMIEESTNLGSATYGGPWIHLPMNKYSKMVRNNMLMIMLRSRIPCSLSACGFSPVSLETFTTVLSTAMSYFTLLRQTTNIDSHDNA